MTLQLSELAIHIPTSISLFEKYGFDYYQQGNQTLKEACDEKGLDFLEIDAELSNLQKKLDGENRTIEDMDISLLMDLINGQHHHNEAAILSFIHCQIQNLISDLPTDAVHLERLSRIDKQFGELKENLLNHCEKEDKFLFPQLKKIINLQKDKSSFLSDAVSKVIQLIKILEIEHAHSVTTLSEIKCTLTNFDNPSEVSEEYTSLMNTLKEFEMDFHVHIHIENNVLFPKIRELDEQFKHHNITVQ